MHPSACPTSSPPSLRPHCAKTSQKKVHVPMEIDVNSPTDLSSYASICKITSAIKQRVAMPLRRKVSATMENGATLSTSTLSRSCPSTRREPWSILIIARLCERCGEVRVHDCWSYWMERRLVEIDVLMICIECESDCLYWWWPTMHHHQNTPSL